jgi:hypothetical protein
LPKCPARSFHKRASEHIPEALMPALKPILEQIGSLTERIRDLPYIAGYPQRSRGIRGTLSVSSLRP